MLSALTLLFGAMLALRFRVLILVPAVGVLLAGVLIEGFVFKLGLKETALSCLVAVICLQIGYLGGVVACHRLSKRPAGRQNYAGLAEHRQ
jgi:hypothetical protein